MASFTSTQAGDWSNAATWGGGGVPGNGDRAVLNHEVEVSDARIVGTSPAGSDTTTFALDIGTTGRLKVTGAGHLKVRGPCRMQQTGSQTTMMDAVRVTAGGRFSFDGTQAAVPADAAYQFEWGQNLWQYRYWYMNAGTLDSIAGAGNGYFVGPFGGMPAELENESIVRRIGDATRPAWEVPGIPGGDNNRQMKWSDVWFDETGGVTGGGNISNATANANFKMERVTFTNTLRDKSLVLSGGATDHEIIDCCFDQQLSRSASSAKFTRCAFGNNVEMASDNATSEDCFIRVNGASQGIPTGRVSQVREYRVSNRDMLNEKSLAGHTAETIDQIIEPLGTTQTDGEYFSNLQNGSGVHTNAIALPFHDGSSQNGCEVVGNSATLFEFVNCTFPGHNPVFAMGHPGHTSANNGVERFRFHNTLMVNFIAAAATKVGLYGESSPPTGNYDATLCVNNSGARIAGANDFSAGSEGNGYNVAPSAGTPGATDVDDIDPQFVGAPGGGLARLHTWARDELGLSAGLTIAQREDAAIAAMLVRNLGPNSYGLGPSGHDDYLDGATQMALHAFVRAGFAPTNPALKTDVSANNGGWIGAVEGVLGTPDAELLVDVQPSTTPSGYVMTPAPVVKMTTDGSTVDTGFTGNVTAALVGAGGILLGTLTVAAIAGVATFSALRPCQAGSYRLRFSAADVADLDSDLFTVTSGSGARIRGGDMPMTVIRRNEGAAALRRIYFSIVDDNGDPWSGDTEGIKAKLSRNGVYVSDSPADIVEDDDGGFYVDLAQPFTDVAEGTVIRASVDPDTNFHPAPGFAQIQPSDAYAAAITEISLVKKIVRASNGADGFNIAKDPDNNRLILTIPGEGPIYIPAVFNAASLPVDSVGE